ncbi:MAG: ABC transporter ATP-binding protein [Rhodocyclaceae bacterium]|nr:ABC transporter ATP-binding protein [Rhodocyclaceae bacterium]MCA3023729.1 ABC transporter ATP-binding protein [Rhodocyclaceae bacterium]MCA3030384.1 ABC transporter ATP-binding protein [Rhodocyclaceae bacterium]MCA3035716.1 ABC transporter ATP-binding protein [Rhodocyclaceae bacterium]MCA3045620.1 ABC transporter ATP-binding protein [Rhodocyclaceae bacterium]
MAGDNMDNLLEVQNLNVKFRLDGGTIFDAVKGVSFDVPRNSTVALVGESGSGKSVSAMSIVRLLPPEQAILSPDSKILFNGQNLLAIEDAPMRSIRGKDISVIFQEPMTSLNPVFTCGDQIAETLRLHMGMTRKQAWARAEELMNEVGIPTPKLRMHSFPHEMSGGQQQRVMIAMAIACEPKLLIADEPTTALDVTIQKQILDLIGSLQQKHKMSVLFITHDLAVVGEIADHVVVMQQGEIKEKGTAKAIFEAPQHPYTKALLSCRPNVESRPKRLPVIEDFLRPEGLRPENIAQQTRGYAADDDIVLDVRNLSKMFQLKDGLFKKREVAAVKGASFKLARGKTLGLVGESGSGKTTVGLTLMRLHSASGGEVLFDGVDLLKLSEKEMMKYKRRIQIVFQNPYASLNPRFTVGQILLEPMTIHKIGANEQERVQMAMALLKRVGMPEVSFYKYPHEFSGGQRQRIAIARCLTMKPDVLICDESVSALDVSVQAQVLNLLQDLQDEYKMSYIFISHDLAVVKYISDQVMVMSEGDVIEVANSDEIYLHPKQEYTKKLLGSIPKGWQEGKRAA